MLLFEMYGLISFAFGLHSITVILSQELCRQPLDIGPCKALIPRFGFINGTCTQFMYGGCGGNGNNFESIEECLSVCTQADPCQLPVDAGMCLAYFPKWAYKDDRCQKFVYGGCGGNTNRFQTEEDCKRKCSSPAAVDVCALPKVAGPCRALIPRWAYEDGACVKFVYGGCSGNQNNFETQQACNERCKPPTQEVTIPPNGTADPDVCSLEHETGPCRALFQRWGYKDGKCVQFTYGGCQGNGNNFETQDACENRCRPATTSTTAPTRNITPSDVCSLGVETGPCRGLFKRWGYKGGKCVQFTYGGCQGNGNNFETQELCEEKCRSNTPIRIAVESNVCSLDFETGPCRALFRKWGYKDGKCVQFTYGGCQGNGNNFETQESCEQKCSSTTLEANKPVKTAAKPDDCSLDLKTGPCMALFMKWGYKNGRCVEFIYGGCQGNKNNFETQEACENRCGKNNSSTIAPIESITPSDMCSLDLETGPCRALFKRWGYKGGKCVQFTYGGCQGNENNFETQEACENRCRTNTPSTTAPTESTKPSDVCSLDLETGPCRALLRRWGYKDGKCVQFTYGGCQGNENNFVSEDLCEKQCKPCNQPIESGRCYAHIPSWGHRDGECVRFVYGGCQGNSNRFSSRGECERRCDVGRSKPKRCFDVEEPGNRVSSNCRRHVTKWFYDESMSRCVRVRRRVCGRFRRGYRRRATCESKCNTK